MARTMQKWKIAKGRISSRNRNPKSKQVDKPRVAVSPLASTPSSNATHLAGPNHISLFTKLPVEIRLKIWVITTEEQMVVIIDIEGPSASGNGQLRSSVPPPAIFHVCKESCGVALDHYALTFSTPGDLGEVYFNFDRDILFLHQSERYRGGIESEGSPIPGSVSWMDYTIFNCCDTERVKHLGLDVSALNDDTPPLYWRHIQGWRALEQFYLGFQCQNVDLNSYISHLPLPEKDYAPFSRAFLRVGSYYEHSAPMPLRPMSAKVEWIRTHCIQQCEGAQLNVKAGEPDRYEEIIKTVRLIKMVNYSSLANN